MSALEDWKASSTRIGAIASDTSTQQMKSYLGYGQGQASRTRARKKRRITPSDEAASPTRSASPNFVIVIYAIKFRSWGLTCYINPLRVL